MKKMWLRWHNAFILTRPKIALVWFKAVLRLRKNCINVVTCTQTKQQLNTVRHLPVALSASNCIFTSRTLLYNSLRLALRCSSSRVSLASVATLGCSMLLQACGLLKAARAIHEKLVEYLVRTHLWFFNFISAGVIINR